MTDADKLEGSRPGNDMRDVQDDPVKPAAPIPFWARVVFGMSLGLIPVWELSPSLGDVYASKMEIMLKSVRLVCVGVFLGSSAFLVYPSYGGVHVVSMAVVSFIVLGISVITGRSLRRHVKVNSGLGLYEPRSIRYSG